MASPYFKVKLDIQHPRRQFHIYVHSGDTPVIRAYMYEDGEPWVPTVDSYEATLGFGEDYEFSTSLVTVDGVASYDLSSSSSSEDMNFFKFIMTSADIATPGDYYCQIMVKNNADTERFVFTDGYVHVIPSPIGGSYSDLILTGVVNWSNNTYIGVSPYLISTEIITVDGSSCDEYVIDADDNGKTFVYTGTCLDKTFRLPAVTTPLGAYYRFLNLTTHIVTILPQSGTLLDGFRGIYSGEGGVNNNPAYSRMAVQQSSATAWNVDGAGRLIWTYLED